MQLLFKVFEFIVRQYTLLVHKSIKSAFNGNGYCFCIFILWVKPSLTWYCVKLLQKLHLRYQWGGLCLCWAPAAWTQLDQSRLNIHNRKAFWLVEFASKMEVKIPKSELFFTLSCSTWRFKLVYLEETLIKSVVYMLWCGQLNKKCRNFWDDV